MTASSSRASPRTSAHESSARTAECSAQLALEATRLFERYQREIVEGFDFCPWARKAREQGRVRVEVVDAAILAVEPLLALIAELDAAPSVDIGVLLFPRVTLGRLAFERFVADLRRQDADRREPGTLPFAMAAFHPEARSEPANAAQLVTALRRTADPTLQLVRSRVLEAVKQGPGDGTRFLELRDLNLKTFDPKRYKGTSERVGEANWQTVQTAGMAKLEACLEAIHADRHESYARLGVLTE